MKVFALFGFCVTAIALVGCSTSGPVDSSGKEVANTYEAFKSGEIRFTCNASCAWGFGGNRAEMAKLYAESSWLPLANLVLRIGYQEDLAYFYLAKAADGLGHHKAAAQYYRAAAAPGVHKCAGAINNCDGHEFPAELQAGIDSLPIDPLLKVLVEKKAPEPTVDKIVSPVTATAVKPDANAMSASRATVAKVSPIGPKAFINGNGYPEITIDKLEQVKLTDAIKADLIGAGWFITEEGNNSFLAFREMASNRRAGFEFAANMMGHRKASSYKDGIYFLLTNSPIGTKVVARPISIRSFSGDEVRRDEDNKKFTQDVINYLNQLPPK